MICGRWWKGCTASGWPYKPYNPRRRQLDELVLVEALADAGSFFAEPESPAVLEPLSEPELDEPVELVDVADDEVEAPEELDDRLSVR
ncbi:hypothetical protein [Sphaerisporangium album]|uniref:hypothetical protein n=1 Tax=Sphaerisporangium album TaxID=509200 RepID=UPI00319DAEB4